MVEAGGPASDDSVTGPFPVYTIGHSTRNLEDFLALLRRERIQLLADIRTFPSSRRYPHFNGDALAAALLSEGIDYRHVPELGGRRKPKKDSRNTVWRNAGFRGYADYMETDEFRNAVRALIKDAEEKRIVIMCAEAVPWRCHRNLVSDALVAAGKPVRHILDTQVTNHELTRFAAVSDGFVRYLPESSQSDLFSESEQG